ncbi:MAG: GlsB/YeaQ/YmgE family stress response membrane protein [Planctomycetota bacterium]
MEIDLATIINWLVVGAIAGGFVGMLLTGRKGGYGWFKNLGMGLLGGVIGGFLFVKLLKLDYGLSKIVITLQDVVAAILGTLIVLLVFKLMKGKGKAAAK